MSEGFGDAEKTGGNSVIDNCFEIASRSLVDETFVDVEALEGDDGVVKLIDVNELVIFFISLEENTGRCCHDSSGLDNWLRFDGEDTLQVLYSPGDAVENTPL